MRRKFLVNLIFIMFLNLLVKPFYIFGIDLQVQNIVGAEDYGMYFSLLNFSFLMNMFLDIGITNYNTKNVAQTARATQKYLGTFFGIKLVLAILYTLLTLSFGFLVSYSEKELFLLSFFIVNQILVGLILFVRSNFAGLHLFKIDAILSVLDRLLLIVISSLFIYGKIIHKAFQIEWFIYMQTFSYFITLLIGIILVRVKIGKIKLAFERVLSIVILKRSFPFALLILLMMLYTRIDSVMIERLLPDGKEQAGIYAQGFRLLDAVNMFAFLITGLLLPIFARLISEKKSIKPILQVSTKLLIGIALVVGIGLNFNAELVISLLYNDHIVKGGQIFGWLILGFIPMAFGHVFGTLLTANNNLRQLNYIAIGGVILNISLNYFLILRIGAKGAAIATLITQGITALLQVALVLRIFHLTIGWKNIVSFSLFLISFISIVFLLKSHYGHLPSFIASFFIGFLLLFVFRIIQVKDLFSLLETKTKPKES